MSDAEDRDQRRETDDEEEDTDEEDDFMKGTTLAKSDMKRTFNGEVTEEQIKRFFQDHHEIVAQPGQDGSFLHIIIQAVYDKTVSASNVKPLIERIMTMYPDLLKYPNSEDQTPLYRAIYLKRYTWKLVDYMLDSCSEQKCVEDALERPCSKGEKKTCLTLAFEKDLKAKVLKNLINHAREKALELSDGSGRTPFHSAVKYEQCSDERVDVIRLLLDIDQKAAMKLRTPGSFRPVETFLDHKYMRTDDHIEYSVYGEHERTAKAYLAAEQVRKEKEEREDRQRQIEQERPEGKTMSLNPTSREKDPPKLTPREKDPKSQSLADRDRGTKKPTRDRRPEVEPVNKSLEERERQRQQLRENERRMKEERDERGPQRESFPEREASRTRQFEDASVIISKIQTNQIGTDHAPNTPLKRVSTQTLDIEEEKKRRNKKVASSSKSASKKPDPKVLAKNSATILRMLKLHYMRTRTIKMATAFLYGKNIQQDIQICFDYEGLPSEIQDHVFNERFGKDRNSGIKFDEVLMYVRFPSVTVIRTVRKAQKPRALGRQDMEFFFDWLYNKGVRRILKVEVEEGDKIQHSDESIQNALDKITVEHLDWQKTDLEPRVICRISSKTEAPTASEGDLNTCTRVEWKNKLREVTLKWSGNNAVLRAWSEPEGLPQLQKLKVVNLSMPAYSDLYDTRNWVQSNLEEFRLRLNKNVNLERTIKANTETSATSESGSVPTEQKTEYAKTSTPKERKIGVTVREGKKGTEVAVSSGGAARIAGRTNPVTEHEWLNCMERFAGCMDVFWKYTKDVAKSQLEKVQNDGAPLTKVDTQNMIDLQNLGKDVVVALIDDGVDSCDLAFSGRAIEGKTFDYQDGGVGQYYISAKGHGTEMARMILKVCPMATIYSIRLKTHSDPDSGLPTIDAASAALAIEAALEKHATIISMSRWHYSVVPSLQVTPAFRKLTKLHLGDTAIDAVQVLATIGEGGGLSSLSSLALNPDAKNGEQAIAADGFVSRLLRAIKPQQCLELGKKIGDGAWRAVTDHHGSSLRELRFVPARRSDGTDADSFVLSCDKIRLLSQNCSRLEKLELRVFRSGGDEDEVDIYQSLGRFPRLKRISLILECSVISYPDVRPGEPFIDMGGWEIPVSIYRAALINNAVDSVLAQSIFETMATARAHAGGCSLVTLKLQIDGACNFGLIMADSETRIPLEWVGQSWLVRRDSPDGDIVVQNINSLVDDMDVLKDDFPERDDLKAVWVDVWPGSPGDRRNQWHSFPLVGSTN